MIESIIESVEDMMKDEPIRTAIVVDLSDMHPDIQATIRGKALSALNQLEAEVKRLREFYKLVFRYWMIPDDTPTDKRMYEAIADLDYIVIPSKEEQIKIVTDILKDKDL